MIGWPILDAREREREHTIARFLTLPEAGEATWIPKPAMEPECLRTLIAHCDSCSELGPVWRYEIDEQHFRWLMCTDAHLEILSFQFNGMICQPCAHGFGPADSSVGCENHHDPDDECIWSQWLDQSNLPWLCARCWKAITADEAAHVERMRVAEDGD